ncbi:MAG: DUF61 family protein [Nitrososphaerota archaeon]
MRLDLAEKGWEGREEVWLSRQARLFRELIPVRRASVRELLSQSTPFVETRGGGRHYFSKKDLEMAASKLRPELLDAPILPIVFTRGEAEDTYIVREAEAAEAFATLSGLRGLERLSSGEFYTYKSLILHFLSRYPSLGVITG